jgi:hypothetical protein
MGFIGIPLAATDQYRFGVSRRGGTESLVKMGQICDGTCRRGLLARVRHCDASGLTLYPGMIPT